MASITLSYRKATLADAPMLQDMVQSGFRASDTRTGWTGDLPQLNDTFTIELSSIQDAVNNSNGAIIIATDFSTNDGEATVVACFDVAEKSKGLARFAWFVVAQAYQQRGVGRKILAYAEKYAQEKWAVARLEMNALSNRRELIAWYERNGYSRTGVTIPFPVDKYPDGELPKDLCFVMLEKELKLKADSTA